MANKCRHDRRRNECRDCGGGSICEHDRIRSKCKECGGGSICEHKIVRGTCSICAVESVYKMYAYKAGKRGLRFEMTLPQFQDIVQRCCVFCGERSDPRGVDRRDNGRGYVFENCQSCCGPCNKFKGAKNERTFLSIALKIAEYQDALQKQRAVKSAVPPLRTAEPTEEPTAPNNAETLEEDRIPALSQLQPHFRVQDPNISLDARRYLDGV
jgi:hypothetical protein